MPRHFVERGEQNQGLRGMPGDCLGILRSPETVGGSPVELLAGSLSSCLLASLMSESRHLSMSNILTVQASVKLDSITGGQGFPHCACSSVSQCKTKRSSPRPNMQQEVP